MDANILFTIGFKQDEDRNNKTGIQENCNP